MKICENLITDYLSANFTEDEPLWLVASTYNNGDEARDGHYIYKYAGVDGTNTTTSPILNPLSWYKTKTSNYYAMLGDRTSEQTTTTGDLIIEIQGFNYDTISLLNLSGTDVLIEVIDNGIVVFTDTKNLINTNDIIDAYTHYFGPYEYSESYYQLLPILGNVTIRITVYALNGFASIGRLVCGQSYEIGLSLFGASQSLESYSVTETDEFGTTTLTPREAVYNSSFEVLIPSQKTEALKRKRKNLDAIPILFIGDEAEDSTFGNLLSYGLWESADILLSKPMTSEMNITIKELL